MANTTNYNWETPDDTDLVKDGAAAIRTLGNSIDTTTKNLNPETTTGDIAYRSATANTNTRLAIGSAGQVLTVAAGVPSWATPTVGDITEVQAGVGISIASGTGPIPVITNSSTDLITTAGDLLYGTAADTVARLGIGTAGQVLKVNSGATAPEWGTAAGGAANWSLLNSGGTTLSGAATITVSGISGADKIMILVQSAVGTGAQNAVFVRLNTDTGSNYYRYGTEVEFASSYAASNLNVSGGATTGIRLFGHSTNANSKGSGYCLITGCNTSGVKVFTESAGADAAGGSSSSQTNLGGYYDSASAITSISLFNNTANFASGTVYVYTSAQEIICIKKKQ